jgi:arginase
MTVVTCAVGVPIDSVGRSASPPTPFGTEQMPAALRAAGLVNRLNIPDHGDLNLRLVGSTRDPFSGLVSWPSVDTTTRQIRSAVRDLVSAGERPLLLGGCCALLPGAVAGLRDVVGTAGVVNVDGHIDLYDATTSPTGEAADVPIAALLDLGVPAMNASLHPTPVVSPQHVALVGHRDSAEAVALGSTTPPDAGITGSWDVMHVRQGAATVARQVLNHISPTSFWVHLDLDVLDQSVFPATDYLMPNGLTWTELTTLLRPLVRGQGFAGMSVACLNPDKDPGGACAVAAVDALVTVLS